jgi:FemAB-related protein (PEP-CTERM system-associated)
MNVFELSDKDRAAWDAFVYNAEEALVYHLAGWQDVMQDTFGTESHFLFAREGGEVRGVLPLLRVNSVISGRFLTSMPGGLCAQDERVAEALLGRAKELTRSSGANYLTLRDSATKWDDPELHTNGDHVTLVVELSEDTEQVWRGIKKRARQLTNKAVRAGVEILNGSGSFEEAYPAYLRAMRDKGTPTLGIQFFRKLMAEFPGCFRFFLVRHEEQILGGGFVTPFKDTVYCTWGGMLREFYHLRPNHLLYWETLKFGAENGFHWLDLGRSKRDSGTFVFKKNWGAKPQPLYQQYYLNGVDEPPSVGGGREDDAQYRLFTSAWRRLPLPLTEILGPQVRKRMPFG